MIKSTNSETQIYSWIEELFPLSRSIVGEGISTSQKYLSSKIVKKPIVHKFKSGSVVGDWEIPQGWILERATIRNINNNFIISTEENNLHVWSHSVPFSGIINYEELLDHIIVSKNESIPYGTTYYHQNWGFSLKRSQFESLGQGPFEINVSTKLYDDYLEIYDYFIPGASKSEVLFSTYLCHPSMANNELSGPGIAAALINSLSNQVNNYSYRFLILPETIGSIAYLNWASPQRLKNVFASWNLTCLGDDNTWSFMPSKYGNTYSDKISRYILKTSGILFKEYSFLERGSDERQFNSPRANVPMVSVMRSKYHEYDEYHTSLDNMQFISKHGLKNSLQFFITLLNFIERDGYFFSKFMGEPHLKKYMGTPKVGGRNFSKIKNFYLNVLDFVTYSDGQSLLEINEHLNLDLNTFLEVMDFCLTNQLVTKKFFGRKRFRRCFQ